MISSKLTSLQNVHQCMMLCTAAAVLVHPTEYANIMYIGALTTITVMAYMHRFVKEGKKISNTSMQEDRVLLAKEDDVNIALCVGMIISGVGYALTQPDWQTAFPFIVSSASQLYAFLTRRLVCFELESMNQDDNISHSMV